MTNTQKKLAYAGGAAAGLGLLAWLLWPKSESESTTKRPPPQAPGPQGSNPGTAPPRAFMVGNTTMTLKVGQMVTIALPAGSTGVVRSYNTRSDDENIAFGHITSDPVGGGYATITGLRPGATNVYITLYENAADAAKTNTAMVLAVTVS